MDTVKAIVYFFLSTVLTSWFIVVSPLYISDEQMFLSCGIAGGKWGIQILAGLFFLREKKWPFIRRIGFTCLVGSVILLPYCLSSLLGGNVSAEFFVGSLVVAVMTMIVLYYRSVLETGISLLWWIFWLTCLLVAISLQCTIVFHILSFTS